jgi:hypothetical protein
MLILAAKGERPVMFAEIAVRQALHAGKPAPAGAAAQARAQIQDRSLIITTMIPCTSHRHGRALSALGVLSVQDVRHRARLPAPSFRCPRYSRKSTALRLRRDTNLQRARSDYSWSTKTDSQ